MSYKMLALVEDDLAAQMAGVVLRLIDWKRFSDDERAAWLAARKILAGKSPAKDASPATSSDEDGDQVEDPELRSVLEQGVEAIERARAEV